MPQVITRFAPSPTGFLHLGHAYAALFAEEQAVAAGGRFLLRLEDIDSGRCKPEYDRAIIEDLRWMGLKWHSEVRRQSGHLADYQRHLNRLKNMGVIYPCFCTRSDIRREIEAAGHAPHGPDGPLYPGTCRNLEPAEQDRLIQSGHSFALRLNMTKAIDRAKDLSWFDRNHGVKNATPEIFGDIILARKDIPTSYHLAVTVDDALQGVTLVTRGEDLMMATHIHRLLQHLLDFDVPEYQFHGLLKDDTGKRFSKRNKSMTIRSLRESGWSADAVRAAALSHGEH